MLSELTVRRVDDDLLTCKWMLFVDAARSLVVLVLRRSARLFPADWADIREALAAARSRPPAVA
jgi:hypothetical protein